MALPRERKNAIDFNGFFQKKRLLLKINSLEGKNDEDGLRGFAFIITEVSQFFGSTNISEC